VSAILDGARTGASRGPSADGILVEAREVVKHFPIRGSHQVVHALNGVSFRLRRGETLGLVGESGSGKTTLGRCVLRLVEPTSGQIWFDGQDALALSKDRFRTFRPRMQVIFQDPFDSLDPRMTVEEIIAEPLLLWTDLSPRDRLGRVRELLEQVRLNDGFLHRYRHMLSGGQLQRVGIARAIATNPDFLVLDEPTSFLDVSVRKEIVDLLLQLQQRFGYSYLFISHDLFTVRYIADRVTVMYLGKIVEEGPTRELFRSPQHPYTKALLGAMLLPDPRVEPGRLSLAGEIPSPIDIPPGCPLVSRCPVVRPECSNAFPGPTGGPNGAVVYCYDAEARLAAASRDDPAPS
jgi:oligopeptide/dipeptide ABC transporter ATP-binding protein